jgi:hypothetical protein
MRENSTFFIRLSDFIVNEGIKNLREFSDILGYTSSEKLYRLQRDKKAKPSFDIILDIANRFEYLNLVWLITGRGEMYINQIQNLINEDSVRIELNKGLHEVNTSHQIELEGSKDGDFINQIKQQELISLKIHQQICVDKERVIALQEQHIKRLEQIIDLLDNGKVTALKDKINN